MRFVVAAPIGRETEETVEKTFVNRWVSIFAPPEWLLRDEGPKLRSKVMDAVMKTFGLQRLCTSPGHPQANGAVERMN